VVPDVADVEDALSGGSDDDGHGGPQKASKAGAGRGKGMGKGKAGGRKKRRVAGSDDDAAGSDDDAEGSDAPRSGVEEGVEEGHGGAVDGPQLKQRKRKGMGKPKTKRLPEKELPASPGDAWASVYPHTHIHTHFYSLAHVPVCVTGLNSRFKKGIFRIWLHFQ
jgi:hypothetical protein